MRKTHANDPEGLRRYAVRSRFIPLLGLDNQLVIQVFALGQITQEDFITRFNADRIFMDAEQANARFYDLPYAGQLALVEAQVAKIKGALPAAGGLGKLNMNPSTTQAVGATA